MDRYDGYLLFECIFHNVFLYPFDDQGDEMELLPFFITEEDIQQGVVECTAHLQPLLVEDTDTLELCTKHNRDQKKVEVVW
jgi:hypothetical protein